MKLLAVVKGSVALLLGSYLGLASFAYAANSDDGGKNHPPGPPPEAIEACSGLSEGDQCSFDGFNGDQMDGTCALPPDNSGELSCRPEHMPPPPDKPDQDQNQDQDQDQ